MVSSAAGIFIDPYKEYQRAIQAKSADNATVTNSAAPIALASMKNIGRFHSSLFKGTMVDMPLAVTEGLHAIPALCGEPKSEHAPVTDAKSGFVVAGKVGAFSLHVWMSS